MEKHAESPGNHVVKEDVSDILQYYQFSEEENRPERQNLEYLVTLQLLNRYIEPGRSILELGAAAGQYTVPLARTAKEVTAVDISPRLIDLNRELIEKAGLGGNVTHHVSDAREFVGQDKAEYDAILAMGPLYHLSHRWEREQLLKGLRGRLNKNGLLITTHLSRIGFVSYILATQPEAILSPGREAFEIWQKGRVADHPRDGQFRGYFTSIAEIADLFRSCGLDLIGTHCQDPGVAGLDEIFNRLPDTLKAPWAEFLCSISDDPMALGAGRSILCVARAEA